MKTRNVRIIQDDKTILEESRPGARKAKHREYIRELMDECDKALPFGTVATIEYQQQGAKGWGTYRYVVGSRECEIIK